jgi:ketosteroid isomerase-like protein
MSEENVEVVRRAFEAWNAGDMERLRDLYDPDVIVRGPPGWPEPGPFVGRDAVMRQFQQVRDTFDEDSLEFVSDFAAIGDRVIVRAAWRMIGRGPEGNMEWTVVYTVRRGLVLGLEFFWDHAEALEAAGLSE